MRIVAIDFETANRHRHSACQVAAVLVDDGVVVDIVHTLLDPEGEFEALHMALHGIRPGHVAGAPRLADLWPRLDALLASADRVIAHNAAFDRGVLEQTLARHEIAPPALPWECTVVRARRLLPHLPDHRLPTVCAALGVSLTRHHDAVADALAVVDVALALDALAEDGGRESAAA
jgi:DNA polymerase-3 subunit epsilon